MPAAPAPAGQFPATGCCRGRRIALGQHLKGECQQSVTGENGHRFTELFVAGRQTTAEVIIIHRGQIVVDEGICMDHFNRTSSRHGNSVLSAARFGRQDDEQGAETLAGGEEAVGHGFLKGRGTGTCGMESRTQTVINEHTLLMHILVHNAGQ